ncbi:MAG TPA: hypothetical protein VE645_04710 [Pseudonocardiaceae bacterium]|nr:hypothetical protein [Pseudonocardiaceae bacterium]
MNAAEQLPETQHQQRERGRLTTRGRSTDDGSWTTLLVINELNGAWTFHGLGAPGVKLSQADMVTLVEQILVRAR